MMQPIKKLLGPKTLFSITAVYAVLITIAFLFPGKDIPSTGLPLDKLVHIAIHAGLVFLVILSVFRKQGDIIKMKQLYWVLIGCFIYGIVIEVVQERLVVLRHADVWDLVANSIGILLGVVLFYKSKSYLKNQI